MALENTNDTRQKCCKNRAKIRRNKDNANIALMTPQTSDRRESYAITNMISWNR